MFKVNNKDTRRRRSGIFIVNFEHNSHLDLVFLIVNFEHVIAGWWSRITCQNTKFFRSLELFFHIVVPIYGCFQFHLPISRQSSISKPPEKVGKPELFWRFQGGIKMEHWRETGYVRTPSQKSI